MRLVDLGWAAGIIDGEGCIFINVQRAGAGGRVNPSHRLYIKVTMGNRPAIARLRDLFDVGAVIEQNSRKHNVAWQWMVASREAANVIRIVRPHLIVKAQEADVALEFAGLPNFCGGSRLVPPAELAARHECYEQMRKLKPRFKFDKKRFPLRGLAYYQTKKGV